MAKKTTARKNRASPAKGRCALPGKVTYRGRKRLPDRAFALPNKRLYILFTKGADGKLAPSGTHARSAIGLAHFHLKEGNLTDAEYDTVLRKAKAVLRKCKG